MIASVPHSPGLALVLGVTVAGGMGALIRTWVNDAVSHRIASDFPFGILVINLFGAFLLGLLTGFSLYHGLSVDIVTIGGIGLCGGLTTWSTAIWETLQLLRLRLLAQAGLHVVGGLALGVGAAAAGIGIAALV